MACKMYGVADGTGKSWSNGISETEHEVLKVQVTATVSVISS